MNHSRFLPLCSASILIGLASTAHAQYPTIYPEVEAESEAQGAAASKLAQAAWEKAKVAVDAGIANGKPYILGAAKPSDLPQASIPSFPGAQGGGMYSFGGRGGKVYVVNNLGDRGPGTFREALEAGGARIVVFNVAGIIRLNSRIVVRAPYLTIAGQSAPGDGVCIAGNTVELATHDVVIRHMRFRRGATWVGERNDSIGGNPVGNIMIDHVSASWGLDENMSMYRHLYQPPEEGSKELKLATVNITIQNSIFSEGLNTYNHAFGSTIGGYNSTFHHNLWASNTGRNPSVGMIYDFTLANNVIYNWRHRTVDGGDQRSFYTVINNYFKPGPATPKSSISHRILKPESKRGKESKGEFGKAYVAGNIVKGDAKVTADNWADGVQLSDAGDKGTDRPKDIVLKEIRATKPYPYSYFDLQSAEDAYKTVLATAGATLPRRDPVDARVVNMVKTGTVTYKKGAGIITDISQVGGHPNYEGTPYVDTDKDGMPDDWELKNGLNPKDASDAAGDLNGDGYTNIEDFLNGLDPRAPKKVWATPHTYVDLWGGKEASDNTWQTSDVIKDR